MILDATGNVVQCDGCGKKSTGKEVVRGGIGREVERSARPVAGFHQSFDYCNENQGCFAKAAVKAAQSYKKAFKL
jgi:hypothetical protein